MTFFIDLEGVMVYEILPQRIRQDVKKYELESVEEIRIRESKPIELCYGNGRTRRISYAKKEDILEVLNYSCGYSLYAYMDEIRQGFITIPGGHRIGIVGYMNFDSKECLNTIRYISGLNIRIAHEKRDCARLAIPYLKNGNGIFHTFVVSAPGIGKTTWLRDCIRILSSGADGLKIGVVDERSEIGACYRGMVQTDLGFRTDVLDHCPKLYGMKMLLRTMSPHVIAVDELGKEEEFKEIYHMAYCGVSILGTIHGNSIDEIMEKPYISELIKKKIVRRIVLLEKDEDGRRITKIYDESLNELC